MPYFFSKIRKDITKFVVCCSCDLRFTVYTLASCSLPNHVKTFDRYSVIGFNKQNILIKVCLPVQECAPVAISGRRK